ncbi:hypothetical protein Purlil1_9294 [Purpureocillium lilacinum]|uniref:Uncharacterized protein n=1 Tax=Purpureocillium lilacinum TaxID=33203 RepID=A0ABR0BSP6_PURLI|nr:hypothetical protein Purlil1_9294 [Purpureocillium lilacinum]
MTAARRRSFRRWLSNSWRVSRRWWERECAYLRHFVNRWARRASTATRSWSKRSASGVVEQPSRFDPCRILAQKGIPSAVWFEDALFLYGSDTAVFDLYILVPDVGAASAVLRNAGYRQADFDGLLPDDERACRARGGVRLEPVAAVDEADGTVLLSAADWKFDLRTTEEGSVAPVPRLSSFLESLMEYWLSMPEEECRENYIWFHSLANLISYAYSIRGPNGDLIRSPEFAEQLQPRFRELHYDMATKYPKKSDIASYRKHEYHAIRYHEIQEGTFTPRPYPSGNFPPSLAEYPHLTGLDAPAPESRRKRGSTVSSGRILFVLSVALTVLQKPLQSIDEVMA